MAAADKLDIPYEDWCEVNRSGNDTHTKMVQNPILIDFYCKQTLTFASKLIQNLDSSEKKHTTLLF